MAMVSAKKLIKMDRKCQKFAAMQRKRISFPRNASDVDSCSASPSSMVQKVHFVIYTADQARFIVPLAYLKNEVIRQPLSMSEEEFGLPSGGPITLPCDSAFMSYIISLIKRGVAPGDLHRVVLLSIPSCCCSISSMNQESGSRQLLVY
ncbi:auxin-responsive protein SAUR68-like [Solanum pennellii]|uniref:Auxin-responsive protein SAUR68-like n=1 Tax=Solanum pennellii TaxID=28526 RepID=A0ABM1GM14_SOLPN|nr:auxin-responsive protein SAUR68-like [Solanum pennellii]